VNRQAAKARGRKLARSGEEQAGASGHFLALLLSGPGNYDPARGGPRAERAKSRRDYVLRRMRDMEFIDDAEFDTARASPWA
jgi:membrane peptidoglycan carboxypeptidase